MVTHQKISKSKEKDFLFILILHLLGLGHVLLTRDTFLGKPLLVYAALTLPATFYLLAKKKVNWGKLVPATLVLGLLIGFIFDFINEFVKSWTVVELVFPIKIFDVEPIDNTLWYGMMTFYTLVFYEYFIDDEQTKRISKRFKYILGFALCSLALLLFIFFFFPSFFLSIPYPYFVFGTIAILLPLCIALVKPWLVNKMILAGAYFFFLYFIFEIIAVGYHYWIYQGNNYVSMVTVFGLTFPFEELFFWMMFYAPSIVAFYEVFVDDGK